MSRYVGPCLLTLRPEARAPRNKKHAARSAAKLWARRYSYWNGRFGMNGFARLLSLVPWCVTYKTSPTPSGPLAPRLRAHALLTMAGKHVVKVRVLSGMKDVHALAMLFDAEVSVKTVLARALATHGCDLRATPTA